MYFIKRDNATIGGQVLVQELMEYHDGRIMFRSHFERSGFNSLSFETRRELIAYLDAKCVNYPKMFIVDDKLWYPQSEGDRELCYFGDIGEE